MSATEVVMWTFVGLAIGALILSFGYVAGREAGRNERDDRVLRDALAELDPEDKAGRLPSEFEEIEPEDDDLPPAGPLNDEDDWPTQDIGETDAGGKHYRPEPVPADWRPQAWVRVQALRAWSSRHHLVGVS